MESEKVIDTEKIRRFWVTEAEDALRVADHLIEKEDFSYALFFGHLALEKLLKALCVQKFKDHAPPVHSLVRLAKVAGIELDERTKDTLMMITAFHIESRYPDFKKSFREKCTQEFTFHQMIIIKRTYEWLTTYMK